MQSLCRLTLFRKDSHSTPSPHWGSSKRDQTRTRRLSREEIPSWEKGRREVWEWNKEKESWFRKPTGRETSFFSKPRLWRNWRKPEGEIKIVEGNERSWLEAQHDRTGFDRTPKPKSRRRLPDRRKTDPDGLWTYLQKVSQGESWIERPQKMGKT
jgi:hypothetical protein